MMKEYDTFPAALCGKKDLKVLFVCLGNICRSPAAEQILCSMAPDGWTVDSAGTGRYHIGSLPDSRMRLHARRRGYELTHRCRQVKADDFYRFDLIIGMDDANVSDLHDICPDPALEHKIHRMAEFFEPSTRFDYVPDPYYEGAEGFEIVLDLLEEGCRRLTALASGPC